MLRIYSNLGRTFRLSGVRRSFRLHSHTISRPKPLSQQMVATPVRIRVGLVSQNKSLWLHSSLVGAHNPRAFSSYTYQVSKWLTGCITPGGPYIKYAFGQRMRAYAFLKKWVIITDI